MELPESQARLEFALSLVRQQAIVMEAAVGDPVAHRAAEDLLALLHESLFLLTEVDKTLKRFPLDAA